MAIINLIPKFTIKHWSMMCQIVPDPDLIGLMSLPELVFLDGQRVRLGHHKVILNVTCQGHS